MAHSISDIQVAENVSEPVERAEIDASCRVPVLYFYVSALFWLVTGTALSFLSTLQVHLPGFLADTAWLSFGRVQPAAWDMLGYGWLFPAGMGTALWLLSRLSHSKIWRPAVLILAGGLWNLGVFIGTVGILSGQGTSVRWLEFPVYTAPILFTAYALIGVWAVGMFCLRRRGRLYISEWYLIAAFFWFPWAYATSCLLLFTAPVEGVVQAVIASWYGADLVWLWWTPLALAAAYYFLSQVTGRTIAGYHRALTAFWLLALLAGLSGADQWIGGPIPAWLLTVSIIAGVLMVIPLLIIGENLLGTLSLAVKEKPDLLKQSPTLRFINFGSISFLIVGFLGVFESFRSLNKWVHFTYFTVGYEQLALYGFLSMTFFGALYYIVPRLVDRSWPRPRLIGTHFWFTAVGIAVMVTALILGGIIQGIELANAAIPFDLINGSVKPFLIVSSLGLLLILLGQLVFLVSFSGMFSLSLRTKR